LGVVSLSWIVDHITVPVRRVPNSVTSDPRCQYSPSQVPPKRP